MAASSILLVATDRATGEAMSAILSRVGHTVTTSVDPAAAFGLVADHDLVILEVTGGTPSGLDLCREIRSTPALSGKAVMCVSPADDVEERIRFLEAGADDVIARPFDDRELEARVEALNLRFRRSRDRTAIVADGAIAATVRTVAVHSPKGGVGTTTIATNVALAAALRKPDRVAIIDLALPFGGVAMHLNLTAKQTLADVARDEAALAEGEILRTYATRHASGLHVIASPGTPEQAAHIEPRHVDLLLRTALETYDAVVIDAGSSLDERTMTVFERADSIIVPVYPEISALKAVQGMLDHLTELGSLPAKMTFVLNNAFAREILRQRDIESALATRVTAELPYDPFVYLKAVNEGVPVVQGAPRSPAAERLAKLSNATFGEDGLAPSDGAEPRKGILGGLLRR